MTATQLELPFMKEEQEIRVNRVLDHMERRFEKNRKCLFVKNSELRAMISELQYKIDVIERNICKKTELGF